MALQIEMAQTFSMRTARCEKSCSSVVRSLVDRAAARTSTCEIVIIAG
jgi:hypothetical protein